MNSNAQVRVLSTDIPVKGDSQVIEFTVDECPDDVSEIIAVLDAEESAIDLYLRCAKLYFWKGQPEAYFKIIQRAFQRKDRGRNQKAYIALLDHLGSFLVSRACSSDSSSASTLMEEATAKFNEADKLDNQDELTIIGKAILLMVKRSFDNALMHFNLAQEKAHSSICCLMGIASIAFARKDYKESLAKWRKVLRTCPWSPPFVRFAIGCSLWALGRFSEAEEAFHRMIELVPQCVEAFLMLAAIQKAKSSNAPPELQQATVQKHMQYISQAYKLNPQHPVALIELAAHFFYRKQFTNSQKAASEALSFASSDEIKARAAFWLARSFHAQEAFEEAFKHYFQSTKLEPSFAPAQIALAQCYLQRGESGNAIQTLEAVVSKHPNQYEALKLLSILAHNTPKEAKRLFPFVERFTKEFPADLEGIVIYASALENHNPEEAIEQYQKAIFLMKEAEIPIAVQITSNLSTLLHRIKRTEEALQTIESLSLPLNPLVLFNKARMLEDLKERFQEAIPIYHQLIEEHPSFIDPYLRLAAIHTKAREFDKAEELLLAAKKTNENSLRVNQQYAHLQQLTKSTLGARKAFENILVNIDRHDVYSLLSLGNFYLRSARKNKMRESDVCKAMDFFQKVLTLDSHNIYAANGIGMSLQMRGHLSQAKEIFVELKQNENDFPDAWINLGHLCLEGGQTLAALNLYENCSRKYLSDSDPVVLMFIAKCWYILGREEGNFSHLDRAIEILQQACTLETGDLLLKFNLAMCKQEFATLRLERESCKRTMQDIHQACAELDSSIEIYRALTASSKESAAAAVYDREVLKKRLERSLKIKESAAQAFIKQQQDDDLRKQKMEQLMQMRKEKIALAAEKASSTASSPLLVDEEAKKRAIFEERSASQREFLQKKQEQGKREETAEEEKERSASEDLKEDEGTAQCEDEGKAECEGEETVEGNAEGNAECEGEGDQITSQHQSSTATKIQDLKTCDIEIDTEPEIGSQELEAELKNALGTEVDSHAGSSNEMQTE